MLRSNRAARTPLVASLLLAGLAALASFAHGAQPGDGQIDFERAARAFVESRGVKDPSPDTLRIESFAERHFVRARLGGLEVLFPRTGLEKRGDDLKAACQALLEAQAKWLDWLKPAAKDQKALREDLAAASAWVKGWKLAALAKPGAEGASNDLVDLLGANEAQRGAVDRVAKAFTRDEPIGLAREDAHVSRLYLVPTRRDFVELLAFIGWTLADRRPQYWVDSAADWTQALYDDAQVIALEYGVANRPPGQYDKGTNMNQDDPTVLQQQVAQLGLNALLDAQYQGRVPTAFTQGLSINLVIDQYGEINTRVDGDTRGRTTSAREVFVPGGDPDGGHLAKNSAETRWRTERGKDHWIHMLRLAQKDGEGLDKNGKNRPAQFAVRSDDGGKQALVKAPFLGSAAAQTAPPAAEFTGDYTEFLRAYKGGFIEWLQTKAAGSEKSSREAFAKLLARIGDPSRTGDFEAAFAELYGKQPLSSPACDKETLEGQFLLWLQKQK